MPEPTVIGTAQRWESGSDGPTSTLWCHAVLAGPRTQPPGKWELLVRIAEDELDRVLLGVRKQMRISLSHLIGLMTRPGVDDTLVDAFGSTVADKTVTEGMPPPDLLPPSAKESLLEMVIGFVCRYRSFWGITVA